MPAANLAPEVTLQRGIVRHLAAVTAVRILEDGLPLDDIARPLRTIFTIKAGKEPWAERVGDPFL